MKYNLKKTLQKINKVLSVIEQEIYLLWKETKEMTSQIKKHLRHKNLKKNIKGIVIFVLALGLFTSGLGVLWFASIEIPDLSSFDKRILGQSTKIYDRTGKVLLYDLSQNIRRTVIPFDKISPNVKNATLAIEDIDFYKHKGIKITSIIRATLANLFSLEFNQGGSTITQQVVKNSLLTKDKTITRKIKEMFLSLKLERNLSKEEIFNLYLNEAPYGGTIYGIEEASQAFFAKSATDLSIAESAYLAAIPQAPTHYSPYGKYRDDLEKRKNLVLSQMKENNFISEKEYEEAKVAEVKFEDQVTGGIKAPHFVMFIKEYLEENYGDQILAQGGLKVTTTLDYELQKKAEEIVKKHALINAEKYNASNSSLVATNPKTGGILVMVGSRDFFDEEIDGQYNIATARRQPGSSFKPFVYAEAFNKGYTPETILFDLQTQFSANCEPNDFSGSEKNCYSPQNYDGKFRGPISLRSALAGSINIPAVKVLYLVGIQNALDLAKQMGISTLTTAERYGLTLVLGGGEVSLLDMTSAYSVFATGGIKHQTHGILKIEDQAGNILEEEKLDEGVEVLPKNTALTISNILSDNVARTPVFGANSSLYFPDRDVAVKTGTTNDYRDVWTIGYSPQIAVGAWDGNNDNSPINKQVAGFIVAPMWHEFMAEALKNLPDERFEKPQPSNQEKLKPIMKGVWKGVSPTGQNDIHSILYYVDKNNPLGEAPKNPWNDPQFTRWEYSIQKWVNEQGLGNNIFSNVPTSNQTKTEAISVRYVSPSNNETFSKTSKIYLKIDINSQNEIARANYFLNNIYLGSNTNFPFDFSFIPEQIGNISEKNILKVVVADSTGNSGESSISIEIK